MTNVKIVIKGHKDAFEAAAFRQKRSTSHSIRWRNMHQIKISDDVYDYLKHMIEDAAIENETPAERITMSEAIGRLIEDREEQ